MIPEEREYQVEAVSMIQTEFRNRLRKILLVLFMGLGKTHVASNMIKMAVNNRKRVLFLAHRYELIAQARDKFISEGLDVGVIMDGFKEEREKPVQVASIQTLNNRELPIADIVFIDEAHRTFSQQYMKNLREYDAAGAYFIGLTATPFRTKRSEALSIFWEGAVRPITVSEAIEQGYVCQSKVYACARIVTAGMEKTARGEFKEQELMRAFDADDVYVNLITNYKLHIGRDRAIVFCINVDHSKKTCAALIEAGYRAVHVDSQTPKETRKRIIADYKDGFYDALVNVDMFTEGFDCPEIRAVVLNMATSSKSRYFQAAGRASRKINGDPSKKFYKVLDMADNTKRFGFVEDHYEINLDGQEKKKKKSGVTPVKDCPFCGFMMPVITKICPDCGKELPVKKDTRKVKEEAFIEMDRKEIAVKPYIGLPKKRWSEIPSDLLPAFAKASNFPNAGKWVKYQLAARGEGKKQVRIKGYTGSDYYKQAAILQKAYYEKKIPIDAAKWGSPEETDTELVFTYRLSTEETLL